MLDMDEVAQAADSQATSDTLMAIKDAVGDLEEWEKRIKQAERIVAEYKATRDKLARERIPELLRSAGLRGLPLDDGRDLELTSKVKVSIPSGAKERDPEKRANLFARRGRCFAWLVEHGHGDLIEEVFTAKLPLDSVDRDKLDEFASSLAIDHDIKRDIHPSRLRSAITRERKKGKTIPVDDFVFFEWDEAVVK